MADIPHARIVAVGTEHDVVAVPYTAVPARPVRSSCLADTLNVGLLMVFPCEPMARASSSVGISYPGVFLVTMVVYGGGIACFGASAAIDDSLFDLSVGYTVLVAWILSMVGAVPSIPFVLFCWAFAAAGPYIDDDPDTTFHASSTSQTLVAVFMCCQVALLPIVWYLRHEILFRSGASSCCSSCIGSFCFTLCVPCCSFAEAMQRARVAQGYEEAHGHGQDELPAYVA